MIQRLFFVAYFCLSVLPALGFVQKSRFIITRDKISRPACNNPALHASKLNYQETHHSSTLRKAIVVAGFVAQSQLLSLPIAHADIPTFGDYQKGVIVQKISYTGTSSEDSRTKAIIPVDGVSLQTLDEAVANLQVSVKKEMWNEIIKANKIIIPFVKKPYFGMGSNLKAFCVKLGISDKTAADIESLRDQLFIDLNAVNDLATANRLFNTYFNSDDLKLVDLIKEDEENEQINETKRDYDMQLKEAINNINEAKILSAQLSNLLKDSL